MDVSGFYYLKNRRDAESAGEITLSYLCALSDFAVNNIDL